LGVRRAQDAPFGAAVFEAFGENDAFDADRLGRELEAARDGTGGVVIDLTGATFVDSSFVGVLLVQLKVREQRLAVVVPVDETNAVRRIFTMAHLTEVLPVYETRAAALAAVASAL
jgi:anti-sigma B factor antagonist